jgi:hypothetical protein
MTRSPAYDALKSIEEAIRDLARPIGTGTEFSPGGSFSRSNYRVGEHQRGYNPDDPDVVAVREDLIGAAFVIVQTHAANKPKTQLLRKIQHVANYWKHRDQWDSAWEPENELQKRTIDGVCELGACPPVTLGQLERLAEAALGQRFDADTLWNAVET